MQVVRDEYTTHKNLLALKMYRIACLSSSSPCTKRDSAFSLIFFLLVSYYNHSHIYCKYKLCALSKTQTNFWAASLYSGVRKLQKKTTQRRKTSKKLTKIEIKKHDTIILEYNVFGTLILGPQVVVCECALRSKNVFFCALSLLCLRSRILSFLCADDALSV